MLYTPIKNTYSNYFKIKYLKKITNISDVLYSFINISNK